MASYVKCLMAYDLPKRILIVDDQYDVRHLLRAGIESLGHGVDIVDVPSGEEAILVSSQQVFDLLIADIRLPGISGLELKERALRLNPDLKLILVTGVSDPEIRQQASDAKADAFFLKPIEMGDFLRAVERCLSLTGRVGRGPIQAAQEVSAHEARYSREIELAPPMECCLLLDAEGAVLGQAGKFPSGMDASVLQKVAVLCAKAILPFSNDLGADEAAAHLVIRGAVYDLVFEFRGSWLAAVLIDKLAADANGLQTWPIGETFLDRLRGLLDKKNVFETKPAASKTPVDEPPADPFDLDEVLGSRHATAMTPEEIDAYWDTLTEEVGKLNMDGLTYDQARKLGLAPENSV